ASRCQTRKTSNTTAWRSPPAIRARRRSSDSTISTAPCPRSSGGRARSLSRSRSTPKSRTRRSAAAGAGTPARASKSSTICAAGLASPAERRRAMRRALRLFWLALIVLAGGVAPGLAEKRLALVVGNDLYAHVPSLAKAVTDANAIASALRKLDFAVTVAENQSRQALSQTL